MPVLCAGISHRTAPVEVRERFALAGDAIPAAIGRLREAGVASEVVWLSTCNRVEIYAAVEAAEAGGEGLREYFLSTGRAPDAGTNGEVYVLREPQSIEHLFRVASGLDSMVLGETEILGQLKAAYELALRSGHTGRRLNQVFQRAFSVAKRIRSETGIQRGSISVASVAVELAGRIFERIEGRQVLVIGAGDTSEKVARALLSRGAARVWISNRSPERAVALAEALGAEAAKACGDWTALAEQVDIIISSTSASGHVLDAARLQPLLRARRAMPLLLIDLAVPRDIDPAVARLSDVFLYDVDDLQAIASECRRRREAEVVRCEEIVRENAQAVHERLAGRPPSPQSAPSAAI